MLVFTTSNLSNKPLIMRQLIMLPSHSQDTAAIYKHIEQALPYKFKYGNVFNKQTGKTWETI